jgi:uncharacterized protein YecT (DUF1311 family)
MASRTARAISPAMQGGIHASGDLELQSEDGWSYAAAFEDLSSSGLEGLMHKVVTIVACLILVAWPYATPHAQTQQGMTGKKEENVKQADEALNAAYRQLLGKISPAGQSALREAQSTWLHFRDQECDFEALGTTGGSVHSLSVLICKERMTRTRTAELVAQVNCSEGDISCGHQ